MRRSLAIVTTIAALALPATAAASHATSPGAHWPKAGAEIHVDVGDCLRPYWRPAMRAAMVDWSRSAVVTYHLVGCNSPLREFQARTRNYGRTGWYGFVNSTWGSHFTTVNLWLNDYYGLRYSERRRRGAACHELGHALGLDHRSRSSSSCLVAPSGDRYRPDQHDFDQLRSIYRHSHSAGTPGRL
jgi:predicted Zn-dependent protease